MLTKFTMKEGVEVARLSWFHTLKNVPIKVLLETIIVGIIGGMVFTILHFPIPWMLGPLTSVLLWKAFTKRNLQWPIGLRNTGQLLLGYSMGLSFTAESGRSIISQLPTMLLSTVLMVGLCLLVALLLMKMTQINLPTSVMGTTPGGFSQMVILSEEIKGADSPVVIFIQTIRMLLVIFMVPMIVVHSLTNVSSDETVQSIVSDAIPSLTVTNSLLVFSIVLIVTSLAVKFRFPTPWIIGPLITAAVLTVTGLEPPHLPQSLIILAQFCMGVYMGLGMKFSSLGNWKALLPWSVISGMAIVLISLGVAFVLTLVHPMTLSTAFLSIAPGGLPEMGVTAHAVNADISIVTAYQLFRILFILFVIPIFLKWFFGKSEDVSKKNIGTKQKKLS